MIGSQLSVALATFGTVRFAVPGGANRDGSVHSKAQHWSELPLREKTRLLTLSLSSVQNEASR